MRRLYDYLARAVAVAGHDDEAVAGREHAAVVGLVSTAVAGRADVLRGFKESALLFLPQQRGGAQQGRTRTQAEGGAGREEEEEEEEGWEQVVGRFYRWSGGKVGERGVILPGGVCYCQAVSATARRSLLLPGGV